MWPLWKVHPVPDTFTKDLIEVRATKSQSHCNHHHHHQCHPPELCQVGIYLWWWPPGEVVDEGEGRRWRSLPPSSSRSFLPLLPDDLLLPSNPRQSLQQKVTLGEYWEAEEEEEEEGVSERIYRSSNVFLLLTFWGGVGIVASLPDKMCPDTDPTHPVVLFTHVIVQAGGR